MGSDTEIKRNDFKTVVETFVENMKIMAKEIENAIQSQKTKVVESFNTTRLENFLVFQLDDKPIPCVDTPLDFTTSSIALRSQSQKRKQDANSSTSTELSANIVLINNRLKVAAVVLANSYTRSNINTQNTNPELASSIHQVERKMDLVENSLGEVKRSLGDMTGILGSMQKMIGRVLQALARMNVAAGLEPSTDRVAPN